MLAEEGLDAEREFRVMSSGEQRRTLLLRSLFTKPAVVLLDEPYESLDIKARWSLESTLSRYMEQPRAASVTALHRLDEIPPGATHVCLLSKGTVLAAGTVDDVLDSERVSGFYEVPILLSKRNGRFQYERA